MKQKKYAKMLSITCLGKNSVFDLLKIATENRIPGVSTSLKFDVVKGRSMRAIFVITGKDKKDVKNMYETLFTEYLQTEMSI